MQTTPMTVSKHEESAEKDIRRVCFVCTGNTCRSPMAAAVANAAAQKELASLPPSVQALATPDFQAFSAGLCANDGEPIAANAVRALEHANVPPVKNLDYRTHSAHTLTEEEAAEYDLLIGLTRDHALALMLHFPHLAQRITVFPKDISDPYGGTLELYRSCLEQISEGVSRLLFSGEHS